MNDAREALIQIDKKLESQWRLEREKIEANYEIELEQASQKGRAKRWSRSRRRRRCLNSSMMT